MRGFTMILVVYAHVQFFSLNINSDETFTFNRIFFLFRMPLFFFISGFILYKQTFIWNLYNSISFLKKKFLVQIVPTTFFILLYSSCFHINLKNLFFNEMKDGYWFTYTLLEFFIFYTLIQNIMYIFKLKKWENIILLISGIGLFIIRSDRFIGIFNQDFSQLIGVKHWLYYFYFTFGCLTKKYFDKFQQMLDSKYFIPFIHITFLIACICFLNFTQLNKVLRIYIAITGIITVFSVFRKYETNFSQTYFVGRCLQYIGKRTLDIYLLHYFFLPNNINIVERTWGDIIINNPTLEFTFSILLSLIIIIICLIASNILRTSPIIGYYLFGVKQKNSTLLYKKIIAKHTFAALTPVLFQFFICRLCIRK